MKQLPLKTDKFFGILNAIFSTLNIDEILTTVVKEIQSILKADRCTLYLVDRENNELYSKVLQAESLVEIRLPITKSSIAGFSAIAKKIVNVKDAYDDKELQVIDRDLSFDRRWDRESGYRTKSVLVTPIPVKTEGNLIGVFQALNKPDGFSNTDVIVMEQVSYLLGITLSNAFLYQAMDDEKRLKEYIIDNIEEGVCILDIKKRIISASKFLEIMSGMRYQVQEMIGKCFFELFPNFINTRLEEEINEVLLYGFKRIAALEVLEVKIVPYLDDKGRVKKLILIFTPLERRTDFYIENRDKSSTRTF
jgi:transcriptional regulator with GAF, ATPase, and Fis domain